MSLTSLTNGVIYEVEKVLFLLGVQRNKVVTRWREIGLPQVKISRSSPQDGALVFQAGYHPCKRTFKHTLNTYFSGMK